MALISIYDKTVLDDGCRFVPPSSQVDLYILAGQSNAHGHSSISTLTPSQTAQSGLFYSSWHSNTSDASTTQYFSPLLNSLAAGYTRGDGNPTLGGSSSFGPELGFVKRANQINLTGGRPLGIVKYAVGASALVQHGALSDWDLTATGARDGDCWRGFKKALADVVAKLEAANYEYRWRGMIWWQGESGTSVTGLQAFISAVRTLLRNTYNIPNSSQFPVVITGNSISWGSDLRSGVAYPDRYVGFVDAAQYGQVVLNGSLNVHIGNTGTNADVTGNGTNDMFDIGEAYADEMLLAQTGSTPTGWEPILANTKLWVDASQLTGSVGSAITSVPNRTTGGPAFNVVGSATIGQQNGKKVVALSPDQDVDYLQSSSAIATGSTRQIWYLVARPENINSNQDSLWSQVGGDSITLLPSSSTDFRGRLYHSNRICNASDISTTNLEGVFSIIAFDFDPVADTIKTYLNGTLRETFNTQTQPTPWDLTLSSGTATYRLFSQYGAPAAASIADGYIAEALITTDTTNHQKTEGYLAWKWGLQSNLPSGHPYKNIAP